MDLDLLQQTLKAVHQGMRYAIATVVETTPKGTPQKAGAKMVVLEDGALYGTIGGGRNEKAAQGACLKAIKSGKASLETYNYFGRKGESVCGGQMKVFIEPIMPPARLVICGGGHIALPLSALAKILGLRVTILDNRPEFANKKRFPHVDHIICEDYKKGLKEIILNLQTYLMIVTQGNEHDYQCLELALSSRAAGYIGVISSKAKRIKFFDRLLKKGFKENTLKTIHIPAGLDIGSQTPSEIAVSIVAEMIKIKNKEHLNSAKFKERNFK